MRSGSIAANVLSTIQTATVRFVTRTLEVSPPILGWYKEGCYMVTKPPFDFDLWSLPLVKNFLEEHRKREAAKRSVCPECYFESSADYESHTSTCSQKSK